MERAAPDDRSNARKAKDDQIAAEPMLPPPDLDASHAALPLESHLAPLTPRPFAVAGVVENGLVRPLDPSIKLPEHARVVIVATGTG